MDICWVTILVNDMDLSLSFYTDILELPVFKRFKAGEETEIVMLGEHSKPKIELVSHSQNNVKVNSDGISIGFSVKSLDEAMERLKSKGVPIARGPMSPHPSIRFLFIKDPNGIEIQLVESKE